MPNWSPFNIGDLVRLSNGGTMMRVVSLASGHVYATYVHKFTVDDPNRYDKHAPPDRFVLWDFNDPRAIHCPDELKPKSKPKEPVMATQTLYQTNEKKPRYGTFLAKNGKGQFVLEMKGADGDVEAFNESDIAKVVPYTFKAKGYNADATRYAENDYVGTKGDVAIDDVLVSRSGNLYIVTAIDTGCEAPRKTFKGAKLTSTPFGE